MPRVSYQNIVSQLVDNKSEYNFTEIYDIYKIHDIFWLKTIKEK